AIQTYSGDMSVGHNVPGLGPQSVYLTGYGLNGLPIPYDQNFDLGGNWPYAWSNVTGDDFDWTMHTGSTPSSSTGPTGDHTTGSGYYIYTESSSPNYPGKVAIMETPVFDISTATVPTMIFWYHMYGAAMGELHLDVLSGGTWTNDFIPPIAGNQGNQWNMMVADLSTLSGTVKFRFRGITGTSYTSDMAIDDFSLIDNTGTPVMVVTPTSLDFGTVWVGNSSSQQFTIENTGMGNLSGDITTPAGYTVAEVTDGFLPGSGSTDNTITFSVPFMMTRTFEVTFAPVASQSYNGNIVITGNDPNNPVFNLTVMGTGMQPPDIAVNPTSLTATLPPNDSTIQLLTISNAGEDVLNWNFYIVGAGGTGIVVNEVVCAASDWLELYNGTTSPINLQNWVFYWTDTRGYDGTHLLPNFILNPGAYVVLSEASGANTQTHIYLGSNIMWYSGSGGSVSLSNDSGEGIDFVRWGGSTQQPPAGTTWIENIPLATPDDSHSLGRDANSTDTDSSDDWYMQLPSPALQNTITDDIILPKTESTDDPDQFASSYIPYGPETELPEIEPWLVADITSGSTSGGDSVLVTFKFISVGLDTGTYNAIVKIFSNDPDLPLIEVPVTMIVDESGMKVNIKAYLEGPFNGTSMNTFLNVYGYIPLSQPFNTAPWNYNGTEAVAAIPGMDVIDWVLVELRDAPDAASAGSGTMIARQAAFILSDGTIVGLDGSSIPAFTQTVSQNLFTVIWHRNHLAVMSANPLIPSGSIYSYDFTTASGQAYMGPIAHKEIGPGIWGMVSGDGNSDGQISMQDKVEVWAPQAGSSGYLLGDFNMSGNVDNDDKINFWAPNSGRGTQVPY
ncbi:MAG: lamin tail domain-containing protein, partial [Bacteroidales bacterium]|nr:lamin tail domain-containing protein [Bacteroidales bacterium]